MDPVPLQPSCRYLGSGVTLVSARGQITAQAVVVGDWVLAGDGRWARVTHTRRVLHRGALVNLELAGGGKIRATRALPVAIGPGHFANADCLTVGETLMVPVMRVPKLPHRQNAPHLAWLTTEMSDSGLRTTLGTPWGMFLADPQGGSPDAAPTLAGRYRITPAGLVRLAPPPAQARNAMAEALARHHHAVWGQCFPPSPTLFHRLDAPAYRAGKVVCEQALSCRRDGDRIEFGGPRGRSMCSVDSVRVLPRRVRRYGIVSHVGWAFGLTLAGADTLVADGVVAAHYPQSPPEAEGAELKGR